MITPSFGITATERVLPKLALDFTTAALDPRVTFTRTTGASNPATYVSSTGLVTAATNNQPRFDYNPATLACKGLLIEESRTNLLIRSQELENAAWVTLASRLITVGDGAGYPLAPDGTQTTDKLIATSVAGSHNNAQSVTLADNTTYSFSTFFRAAEYSVAVLLHLTKSGGAPQATFNLTTKAVTLGGGATSGSIEEYANGWFRCTLVFSSGTGASTTQARMYLNNGSGTSFAGNDSDGIYAWGAQLEAGAFATSYIPTTTTALTRNADVATMTGTNFSDWFNASEGTFVANSAALVASGYSRAVQVSDNTTSNFINVTTNTSQIRTGGAFQASFASGGSVVAGQYYQTSLAYKLNDCASATNGGTTLTDTSVTLPTVNQMVIGGQTTTNIGSGYIKKIMYWPSRLTNAEIQAFSKQG